MTPDLSYNQEGDNRRAKIINGMEKKGKKKGTRKFPIRGTCTLARYVYRYLGTGGIFYKILKNVSCEYYHVNG